MDRPRVRPIIAASHVALLAILAVTQPTLDMLGRAPEFLAALEVDPADIVVFAVLATVVPAGVVGVADLAAARLLAPRVWWRVHLAAVATLLVVLTFPVVEQRARTVWFDAAGEIALVVAALISAGAAVLYHRFAWAQSYIGFLAPAPVVVPLAFLFLSPVRPVVFGTDPEPVRLTGAAPIPVVVVVFDELPLVTLLDAAGSVDADRFPNLAALARDSHWFRNAATSSEASPLAQAALFTGVTPERRTAPTAGAHPRNLFTLLGDTHAVRTNSLLFADFCPASVCVGRGDRPGSLGEIARDAAVGFLYRVLPSAVERRVDLPAIEGLGIGIPEAARRAPIFSAGEPGGVGNLRALRRVASTLAPATAPSLDVVYTVAPHRPWHLLPGGKWYDDRSYEALPEAVARDRWADDPAAVASVFHRHMLTVAALDEAVGDVVTALDDTGLWDDAVVVVTSDHGGAFAPNRSHRDIVAADTLAQLAAVPLFVRGPGFTPGTVDDRPVSLLDVIPTLVDVLEIDVDWEFDGVSLLAEERPGPTRPFVSRTGPFDTIDIDLDATLAAAAMLRSGLGIVDDPVGDIERYFAVGPARDLVGMSIDDLDIGSPVDADVDLDVPPLDAVDRGGSFLPVLVEGTAGRGLVGSQVVLVLNGRVAAAPTVFAAGDGRARLAGIMAPSLLRDGPNTLEVIMRVDGTLHPVTPTP